MTKYKNSKIILTILATGYLLLATASITSAVSPAIISVYPANGATNIYPRPLITAYFDKDVNPASINNNTFKLKNASFGNGIDGDVSYSLSERKASFKPSGNLAYDNKYTVTITTGAYDLEGNHLISDYVWEFTTIKNTDMPISTAGCDYPIWEWDKLGLTLNEEGKCVKKSTTGGGTTGGGTIGGDCHSDCQAVYEKCTEDIEGGTPEFSQCFQDRHNCFISCDTSTGGGTTLPSAEPPPSPLAGGGVSFKGFLGGIVPCGTQKNPDGSIANPCTICHLFLGISNIIDFLLKNIAFPLGVVAILYGGFMMMTSGGSEERVKKGRTALEFAVYGIIIAFAGWLIVDTILTSLVKGELDLKAFWNAFPGCK